MRTQRRPLALAATIATAFLGVGLVAGATPAAAAAQGTNAAVSDCGTSSTRADGSLDVDRLQVCLDQIQASLMVDSTADADAEAAEPAAEEPVVVEAPAYEADESYAALDAVFAVDVPQAVEEIATVDDGLGGAFAALAECESGGNYSINTGNGYYGAYQFSVSTWQSLGYEGYPHQASASVQDQAARELQALYGWGQWPGCSWYLGL